MDKHFCTCKDTKCADHPANHSDGCDPCIRKNLALGEIPYCFWVNVAEITGKSDYSAQKFADFVVKSGGSKD